MCRGELCQGRTFLLNYAYAGQSRQVKQQIIDMALNGSGTRDTARVLHVSTNTVLKELKKESQLQPVNIAALKQLNPETVEVEIHLVKPPEESDERESELDEMLSYVGKKSNPRWLWHAIDHHSGKVLAYAFGARKDEVFLQLKALLEPFGISRFYTDSWGAYLRHLEVEKHEIGKNNMQKIESKHTNLRARIKRLARRTICFSKTVAMHDIVVGLFIKRYEFGLPV
jgi:IS1 family transposase